MNFIHNVTDHPRWLFYVYVLQALGLPVGHDCGFAPSCQWEVKFLCIEFDPGDSLLWEVHIYKSSTYVLKPPKLGALRKVARDNIIICILKWIKKLVPILLESNMGQDHFSSLS